MSIAFNKDATREYSLKNDTAEPKTVFVLGLFDLFVHARLIKNLPMNEGEGFNLVGNPDFMFDLLRHGLKGWRNFVDDKGQNVPFETEEIDMPGVGKRKVVTNNTLLQLNLLYAVELAMEIVKDNFLSQVEKKT